MSLVIIRPGKSGTVIAPLVRSALEAMDSNGTTEKTRKAQ